MSLAGRHLLVCPFGEAILGVCGGVESWRVEGMLVGCFVLELEIWWRCWSRAHHSEAFTRWS
jgi:hypothetical protein